MIDKGTIVIHIEKGSFQEAYCVGEDHPFILCDYDEDSKVAKHIREAKTKDIVPGSLEYDIEQRREKASLIYRIMDLSVHLHRFTASPMMTKGHGGWSVCNYCNTLILCVEGAAGNPDNHSNECIWVLARKALADADR